MEDLDGIADRLRVAAEDLADAALALVKEALHVDDADEHATLLQREKRVTRARRAVEKAVALLEGSHDREPD